MASTLAKKIGFIVLGNVDSKLADKWLHMIWLGALSLTGWTLFDLADVALIKRYWRRSLVHLEEL